MVDGTFVLDQPYFETRRFTDLVERDGMTMLFQGWSHPLTGFNPPAGGGRPTDRGDPRTEGHQRQWQGLAIPVPLSGYGPSSPFRGVVQRKRDRTAQRAVLVEAGGPPVPVGTAPACASRRRNAGSSTSADAVKPPPTAIRAGSMAMARLATCTASSSSASPSRRRATGS